MDKIIAGVIIGIVGMFLATFLLLFFSVINATIFYFVWNALAPVYFATALPAVFMHLSWWHCFLFMWLLGILRGPSASAKAEK